MRIAIINGPNLNLLGTREPDLYGTRSFETYFEELRLQFPEVHFSAFQSNVEGELINEVQRAGLGGADALVINPGGYTHTSVALGDAIAAVNIPAVEVHISNIFSREPFRRISHVSGSCRGVIGGLGLMGYELAVRYLIGIPVPGK
jgi:3-dehydroquinate dehydratase-2